ncbi:MAG: glycerol-3-phosphate 1-O-acyltransferase PlsY [Lachnospiraceae bacterium]|nr:glycerol-3-phosphate 1-O-acyltransferase PlsY [Lachnospiraceae bacterium]
MDRFMILNILVAVIAYCIGSVSFSIIYSKKVAGFDVREKGSNGSGATNVLRTVGKRAAILTLIFDTLKGVVAILMAMLFIKIVPDANSALLVQIASVAVILGHTFPVFFKFKGGKGVATSLGVLLMVNLQIGAICLVFALLVMALTRTVSIGSIMAALLFPVLTLIIHTGYTVEGNYIIFGILIALIVIYNHRTNIKRIMDGSENKLGGK